MKCNSDHMGVIATCTCLAHCIIFNIGYVIFNLSPIDSHELHIAFFGIAVIFSVFGILHAIKAHCSHIVIGMFILSLVVLGMGLLQHSELAEILTITGSILLTISHVLNRRQKTKQSCVPTN